MQKGALPKDALYLRGIARIRERGGQSEEGKEEKGRQSVRRRRREEKRREEKRREMKRREEKRREEKRREEKRICRVFFIICLTYSFEGINLYFENQIMID
jgi:hypothetical protein